MRLRGLVALSSMDMHISAALAVHRQAIVCRAYQAQHLAVGRQPGFVAAPRRALLVGVPEALARLLHGGQMLDDEIVSLLECNMCCSLSCGCSAICERHITL